MAYKETHQRNSASKQSHYLSLYNQETLIKFPCISIKSKPYWKRTSNIWLFWEIKAFHQSSFKLLDKLFHDPNMPNLQGMDISCIDRCFGILPIPSLMLYMHFQLWIYLWNKNRDVSLILRNAVEGKSHLIRVIPLHRKILNVSWHIMNIHIDYIWRYNDLLKISMILKHSLVFIHLYTHISNKQKSSLCTHGYIQLIQDFFI